MSLKCLFNYNENLKLQRSAIKRIEMRAKSVTLYTISKKQRKKTYSYILIVIKRKRNAFYFIPINIRLITFRSFSLSFMCIPHSSFFIFFDKREF